MTMRYWRSGGLAIAATLATLGLAACGGGSSPHVASLGSSIGHGSGSTTTTLPKGTPTQLLDEWASCMRSRGTPNLADPTIDTNGVIHITMPAASTGSGGPGFQSSGAVGGGPCGAYLNAASTALRGGQPVQKPNPAKLEKYSECMRANGIPDFPDPTSQGLSIQIHPGSDLNPHNPTFQKASTTCAKKTGVPGLGSGPQKGGIEVTSGGPNGAGGPGSGKGSGAVIGSAG
jgi:hypothetical protein